MTTTYDPKLHKIVSRELIENLLDKSKSEAGSFKVKNFGKEADCTTIDGALTYGRSQAYAVSHLMLSAAPEITLNQWQDISGVPYKTPVRITNGVYDFKAILDAVDCDEMGKPIYDWCGVGISISDIIDPPTHYMVIPTPPEN